MEFPRMFAELMGKETGFCRGKGGSMHIAEYEKGVLGANGIVGGGIPIATGAALSSQIQNDGRVTACFFGDGAMAEGAFHESVNVAALWNLPILYVCENNQYGEWTHYTGQHSVEDLSLRAKGYGIPGFRLDGMDVEEVYSAAREAVDRARSGEGPTLLVCDTYRYFGHSIGGPPIGRPEEEVEAWKQRDPINRLSAELLEAGVLSQADIDGKEEEIKSRVEEAVAFAESSAFPAPESALQDLFV
jgi:TPP-dependent pyruvate/acetoin dehydrogenase alpha subunit